MMLVLEIVTLFIKPLLALLVVLADRRGRARQILRRMVEVQNLLINVGTRKSQLDLAPSAMPTKCAVEYNVFTRTISRSMRSKNVSFPYSGAAPT